ncbi:MAG: carbohydrate kinase family protein [Bacteroidales bacterium]|nr:carbohydrate kinase family protein [Bacteroidales bacterium]
MKICVIGGANVDIGASASGPFIAGDSNPGTVTVAPGGVARNIAHNLTLLGDKVRLVTVFGDDSFGLMLRESCAAAGMDLSLSEVRSGARNACFVSLNGSDGELLGGVSDMAITELMTPEWLEARIDAINEADAVVADTNLSVETLSMLIACCQPPLYIDAVSCAKVVRLRPALAVSRFPGTGSITLKCNRLEAEALGNLDFSSVNRIFVSKGSEGVEIIENADHSHYPASASAGIVSTTGAGDALLAGIVHCGPDVPAREAADFGQKCAVKALLSASPVSDKMKELRKKA